MRQSNNNFFEVDCYFEETEKGHLEVTGILAPWS
jgi:hypothetical protein